MKDRQSYKDFLSRTYREMVEGKTEKKKGLDDTNPLLLRIQTLEKKVRELEKKS